MDQKTERIFSQKNLKLNLKMQINKKKSVMKIETGKTAVQSEKHLL